METNEIRLKGINLVLEYRSVMSKEDFIYSMNRASSIRKDKEHGRPLTEIIFTNFKELDEKLKLKNVVENILIDSPLTPKGKRALMKLVHSAEFDADNIVAFHKDMLTDLGYNIEGKIEKT